ncbi:MAG: hypothetical protein H6644_13145 [Caldilineaceae bacterium]|nr:hypothetical protein [Caldilineaceae bacterium]
MAWRHRTSSAVTLNRLSRWGFNGGRFPAGQLAPYIIAQVIGAIAAGGVVRIARRAV